MKHLSVSVQKRSSYVLLGPGNASTVDHVACDACRFTPEDLKTRLLAILGTGGSFVQSTADAAPGSVGLVLERTPFYAESGGQVGLPARKRGCAVAVCSGEGDVQDASVLMNITSSLLFVSSGLCCNTPRFDGFGG